MRSLSVPICFVTCLRLVDHDQVTTHHRISSPGSWFADFSSSPWDWRVTQASNTAGTLSAGCSRRPSLSLVTCPHYQTRSRTVPSQDLHARTTHAETYRRPACLAASSIPIHSHPWFSRPRHDVYAVPVQLSRRTTEPVLVPARP